MSKKSPPVKAIPSVTIAANNTALEASKRHVAQSRSRMMTPAEINKANHEFWEQEKEIEQRDPLRYAEQRIALEDAQPKYILKALRELRKKHYLDQHDLALVTTTIASTDSDDQSTKAQKPRPKKSPTHRSIAIAAMKAWRNSARTDWDDSGTTLLSFIDAASAGSVEGLKIELKPLRGVVKHSVDSDDMPDAKTVSKRTLESWWTEAEK